MDTNFDVFLSHNSRDKSIVRQLKKVLSDKGIICWLDEDELQPGKPWQKPIEDGIKRSKAVAVCFGPGGVGPWHDEEMQAALTWAVKQQKSVIPVILPGAPQEPELPMFLENRTWINLRDLTDKNSIDRLIWGITGAKAGSIPQKPIWSGNPYRSLKPFLPEHAAIFFGREPETQQLLERLRNGQRLIAVIGASGSGKSSLVGAGLLAKLAADAIPGARHWTVLRFTPAEATDNPFWALASRLWPLLPETRPASIETLAAELKGQPAKIKDYAVDVLRDKPSSELLLFVDQFEELFTDRVNADYRELFAELIAVIADSRQLRLILTLRADFYDRCLQYTVLKPSLNDGHLPLFTPDDFALKDIIEQPARLVGITPDADDVKNLIEELGKGEGRLALLEFTLARLYDLGGGTTLNFKDCKVDDAIEIQGNQALADAGPIDDSDLWAVFNALADVDDNGKPIRLRVWINTESFTPSQRHLLKQLEKARLLTADKDENGRPWVEVAHEKVLSAWKKFADWLEANAEFKRWRKRLDVYIKGGELLRGSVLLEAETVLKRWNKDKLNEQEGDFIAASVAQREQELKEKQRQEFNEKWLHWLNVAVVVLGIVSLPVLAFAVWAGMVAEVPWSTGFTALTTRMSCSLHGCPAWVPEMVDIPAGAYQRGSSEADIQAGKADIDEGPQVQVTLKAFRLGKNEITVAQYLPYAEDNSYRCKQHPKQNADLSDLDSFGDDRHPAIYVSWWDAQCYAEWLSFVTDRHYRLPSESEWEYAARARSTGAFYWGEQNKTKDYAWFSENSKDTTHPVGEKGANDFHLYDMAGNVWEWVQDCYQDSYKNVPTDGKSWNPADCANGSRVLRGGSCNNDGDSLRSALRFRYNPVYRENTIGFRLAQDLP